jgi:UTP-glucose-1-phosphate uridylyltransferase
VHLKKDQPPAAIILAGGYGGRFYPFTKTIPKEMLPIAGIPAIHWVVRECLSAGCDEIVVIHRRDTDITKMHFSASSEYDDYLAKKYGDLAMAQLSKVGARLKFSPERHDLPYGTSGPALQGFEQCAPHDLYFIVFADEILFGPNSERVLTDLASAVEARNAMGAIATKKVSEAELKDFGILVPERSSSNCTDTVFKIDGLIQKPHSIESGRQFGVLSRLALKADFFRHLSQSSRLPGIDRADIGRAIDEACSCELFIGVELASSWGTVGDPASYLQTLVRVAETTPSVDIVEFYGRTLYGIADH